MLLAQIQTANTCMQFAAVDVCPQVSVLPGPTVSKAEFNAHRERYAGRRVVCYCTAGLRSGLLASQLRSQGWDAYNLHGSILAWVGNRFRGAKSALKGPNDAACGATLAISHPSWRML